MADPVLDPQLPPPAAPTADTPAPDYAGKIVQVLDPTTGKVEKLGPEDAQAQFLAGKRQLLSGATIPLVAEDGTVAEFPSEKVQDALGERWRFATRPDVLKHDAAAQPIKAALVGAAHELSLGASTLMLQQGGMEAAPAMLETKAGIGGRVVGGGLALVGTLGAGTLAEGAQLSARAIAGRAVEGALAPTRFIDAATHAIEAAGSDALAKAGASAATQRIGSSVIANTAVGAGVGALGQMTEAQLGDPTANAESLFGAAGMGAVIGGAVGGTLGAVGGTIGHLLAPKGTPGALALADAGQLTTALQTQGMEVAAGNPIVNRFVKVFREDIPGVLGFDTQAIRTVNTPQAQAWIRDRNAIIDATSRELDGVVKTAAAVQDQVGESIGALRPRAVRDMIPAGSAGQAVSSAGVTIADIRNEFQSVLDREAAMGREGSAIARATKQKMAALDKFEQRAFQEAGVTREYTERTVEHAAEPGFVREPSRPPGAPEAPAPNRFGEATQQELPVDTNRAERFRDAGWAPEEPAAATAAAPVESGGFDDWGDVMPPAPTKLVDERSQKMATAAQEYTAKLAPEERAALELGAGAGSRAAELRAADRAGDLTGVAPEIRDAVTTTRKLLEQAPPIEAPVFRGLSLKPAEAEQLIGQLRKTGEHVEPNFHSMTYDPAWAEKFASRDGGKTGIVFRIESGATGVPVGLNMREHEVLRAKGAYTVKDIAQDAEGRYQVLLAPKEATGSALAQPAGAQRTFDDLVPAKPARTEIQHVPANAPDANAFGSLGGAQRSVTQAKNYSLKELGERFTMPDKMGASMFEGLDTLRTVLGKVPKGADGEVRAVSERVQKRLQDALENHDAFGTAAEMQVKLGGAIRDRDAAWAELAKHYDVSDPKAAKRFMEQITSMQGDAAKAALDRWVSANQAVGEISDKYYRGSDFGAQARAAATAYNKVTNDMRDKVTVFNALTRLQGQERSLRWGTNNALQYALTGAGMTAAGALGVPGFLGAGAIGAAVGSIMHPGNAAITRANLGVVREKVAKAIGSLADEAVARVASATGAALPSLPRVVGTSTRAMLAAKTTAERAKAYDERMQQLMVLQDPQTFIDHSTRSFGDLQTHAPAHTQAMQTQAQTALQYLLVNLPIARAGTGLAYGPQARPSDGDMLRFALTDRAVQDPLGALHAAVQRGMLLPAERQALEAVSPQLLDGFRQEVLGRAQPGQINARANRMISSIFGGGSATSKWAQAAHQAPEQQGGGAAPGPKPRPQSASAAYTATPPAAAVGF